MACIAYGFMYWLAAGVAGSLILGAVLGRCTRNAPDARRSPNIDHEPLGKVDLG